MTEWNLPCIKYIVIYLSIYLDIIYLISDMACRALLPHGRTAWYFLMENRHFESAIPWVPEVFLARFPVSVMSAHSR